MLADNGLRLKEALEYIERALAVIPESGAYLDSYGWVLFRLGKTDEALKQLLAAYRQVDTDPVILEHISDVYDAMGDSLNAEIFRSKVLELEKNQEESKEDTVD
jgi:tetratricopeptide (TPR) repeat protein